MFAKKNLCNRRLRAIVMFNKQLKDSDIVECPECHSLNLVEKMYVITTDGDGVIEITGMCADCENNFKNTIPLNVYRDRQAEVSRRKLKRNKERLEKMQEKMELLRREIESGETSND